MEKRVELVGYSTMRLLLVRRFGLYGGSSWGACFYHLYWWRFFCFSRASFSMNLGTGSLFDMGGTDKM